MAHIRSKTLSTASVLSDQQQQQQHQHLRHRPSGYGLLASAKSKSSCLTIRSFRNFLTSICGLFAWVSYYPVKKYFFFGDLPAGIYIGLYQVPQCIAYSILTNVPTVYAFYTSIISGIIYGLIGGHRRLSYGVFAFVTAIYTGIILERVEHDLKDKMSHFMAIGMITFLVGVYSIGAAISRLGLLVRFIPYEVLSAFRTGLYVLVFSLQLNSIFGINRLMEMDLGDGWDLLILPRLYGQQLYPHIVHNINWWCFGLSLVCFGTLAIFRLVDHYWLQLLGTKWRVLKELLRRVPVEFILVAVTFTIAYKVDIKKYNVPLVNEFNIGNESMIDFAHPRINVPEFKVYFVRVWHYCITATILAIVYTHSIALDMNVLDTEIKLHQKKKWRIHPKRVKYVRFGWRAYHPNQESFVQGLINVVGSFLGASPAGVSGTRSYRLRNVGGRSQIAGIVGSCTILGAWFGLHRYLSYTPRCVVASIVAFDAMLAFKQEVMQLKHFWTMSIIDLGVWIATFSAFIFLNLDFAIYVSLLLALVVYVYRSRLFEPFRFRYQIPITTNSNSSLFVPESAVTSFGSKFDNSEIEHDGGLAGDMYMYMPTNKLRDVYIFKLDQRHLTVSNVDSFVRDVFRKMAVTMKTEAKTRIIFDCRDLSYLDWPTVRVLKATLMRTIEIADSWRAPKQRPSCFVNSVFDMDGEYVGSGGEEKPSGPSSVKFAQGDEQLVAVAFVFCTRLVQLIHNAGIFNVRFYNSLHKTLHIGLRGAIYATLEGNDGNRNEHHHHQQSSGNYNNNNNSSGSGGMLMPTNTTVSVHGHRSLQANDSVSMMTEMSSSQVYPSQSSSSMLQQQQQQQMSTFSPTDLSIDHDQSKKSKRKKKKQQQQQQQLKEESLENDRIFQHRPQEELWIEHQQQSHQVTTFVPVAQSEQLEMMQRQQARPKQPKLAYLSGADSVNSNKVRPLSFRPNLGDEFSTISSYSSCHSDTDTSRSYLTKSSARVPSPIPTFQVATVSKTPELKPKMVQELPMQTFYEAKQQAPSQSIIVAEEAIKSPAQIYQERSVDIDPIYLQPSTSAGIVVRNNSTLHKMHESLSSNKLAANVEPEDAIEEADVMSIVPPPPPPPPPPPSASNELSRSSSKRILPKFKIGFFKSKDAPDFEQIERTEQEEEQTISFKKRLENMLRLRRQKIETDSLASEVLSPEESKEEVKEATKEDGKKEPTNTMESKVDEQDRPITFL